MIFPRLIFKIERWKFNKDFGVYVSTLGHFKDRHKRNLPIKINQKGYCTVITEQGAIYAHRLVLFTWRPIPNAEALTVDHLDHNKRNNSLTNLEWVTQKENLERATQDYIITPTNIENNKFYFVVNGIAFESIQTAYENILKRCPKNMKGNVSLERVTKYFEGLAREREKNNKTANIKSYCQMDLSVIKKGE